MSGSFDYDGSGSPLGQDATPVVVARYDGEGTFDVLPNVVCEGIDWRIGGDPPVARFRYLLDVLAEVDGFPVTVKELWPLDAFGPHVVKVDDRLVVIAYTPDGEPRYLFDGHAQIPQADQSSGSVNVSFTAVGVAARCSDLPIGGRLQRDADDLDAGDEIQTDLPTRFNPTDSVGRMLPNCSPAGKDVDFSDSRTRYPVFVEERLERDPDPRRLWNLSGVVRYLLAQWNDEEFVKNPDFGPLDKLLKVRSPKEGSETYDPSKPSTYDEDEITVREYDATNRTLPDALRSLLGYSGFGFSWRLSTGSDGLPENGFQIYRLDQASDTSAKVVWLDAGGSALDPTRNVVESFHLARDTNQVVNAFTVETGLRRMEISVVLAPWFIPDPSDATAANRIAFLKSKLDGATAEVRRKYRFYVADEAGDGHYEDETSSWTTTLPLDLDDVFPPKENGDPAYCRRLRPGSNKLIARDSLGRPRPARLSYSQDYAGPVAWIWDGTGTWTDIGGGWKLLDDRLGIEVTIEDPEAWFAGGQAGEIRGVTWQADPPDGKQFWLRLTTVIEDDLMLAAVANKRLASPTEFSRYRAADARDVFRMEQIHPSSTNYVGDGYDPQVVRDDTQLALDHARMLRAAHETPPLAGSIVLPYCTNAYEVGDRIRRIKGREIPLRANVGEAQGEAAYYPAVVAVSWSFVGDRQSTTLQLSDRRAEPQGA